MFPARWLRLARQRRIVGQACVAFFELSFEIVELPKKIEAKYGRCAFLRWRVNASLPIGDVCEIVGSAWKISGSFALGNDRYEFDGKGLFCNGKLIFTYYYSHDMFGVGQAFSIYSPSGEFLYSLRPGRNLFSSRSTVFSGPTNLGEISRNFLGTRFTAQFGKELPPELMMLFLWVVMTKMV